MAIADLNYWGLSFAGNSDRPHSLRRSVVAPLLLAILSIGSHLHAAEPLFGKVIGIADGDTVTVLVNGHDQVHVRVMGIDAPEKKQAFGQRSKQAMSDCAYGKQARVDWRKTDRYGRTIGKITVDGVDCGLRQIKLGLAWHYKAYEREQPPDDRLAYATAESLARSEPKGLWVDSNPKPPWEFRHAKKSHD